MAAAHLPTCPVDAETYQRLYAFNRGVDSYTEGKAIWQELRVAANLSEENVYRRLPNATHLEYGGYLTKSRIRFQAGTANSAHVPYYKACTFHSHPTDHPHADVPSAVDIFQFLNFRHLRTITVGRSRIWVWDKNDATLTTVRRMARWMSRHALPAMRKLEARHEDHWHGHYMEHVLHSLGLRMTPSAQWAAEWPELLRTKLQIQVRLFPKSNPSDRPH